MRDGSDLVETVYRICRDRLRRAELFERNVSDTMLDSSGHQPYRVIDGQ